MKSSKIVFIYIYCWYDFICIIVNRYEFVWIVYILYFIVFFMESFKIYFYISISNYF